MSSISPTISLHIPHPSQATRPMVLALLTHAAAGMILTMAHFYNQAIPVARELAPLEVVVVGNLELDDVQQKARLRTSLQDLRQGVVITEQNTKQAKDGSIPSVGSGGGKFGKLLSMTENPEQRLPDGKSLGDDKVAAQNRMALAVVEKTLRDDFLAQAGKGGDTNGLRVVNKLPDRVKGIEWKQLQPPTVKAPSNLNAEELEKLRLYFASKWVDIRDCYESALQRDEKLSGYVNLQVMVGSSGRTDRTLIEFKGEGDINSQRSLKSCLGGVTQGMKFLEKLSGQTLQVGYRLSS